MQVLILADDLTGAADTGVMFRSLGRPVRVIGCWDRRRRALATQRDLPDDAVLVIDTQTRDATDEVAGERLRWLVRQPVVASHRGWMFKKIDSLLRGPIAAELQALRTEECSRRIVCAPALPAAGRTTVDGRQLVHGQPMGSSLRGDPRSRSASGEVRGATGLDAATCVAADGAPSSGDVIVDATSDTDLDRVIAQLGDDDGQATLLVGTAGLAAALARRLRQDQASNREHHDATAADPSGSAEQRGGAGSTPGASAGRPALVVSLSPSPVARRQVAHVLARTDAIEVRVDDPAGAADGTPTGADRQLHDVDDAVRHLSAGGTVVLTTHLSDGPPADDRARARVLQQTVAALRALPFPPTIVANGGDAAHCVLTAAGADALDLVAALPDGAVRSRMRGSQADAASLLTKSGSFGPDDALYRALSTST